MQLPTWLSALLKMIIWGVFQLFLAIWFFHSLGMFGDFLVTFPGYYYTSHPMTRTKISWAGLCLISFGLMGLVWLVSLVIYFLVRWFIPVSVSFLDFYLVSSGLSLFSGGIFTFLALALGWAFEFMPSILIIKLKVGIINFYWVGLAGAALMAWGLGFFLLCLVGCLYGLKELYQDERDSFWVTAGFVALFLVVMGWVWIFHLFFG